MSHYYSLSITGKSPWRMASIRIIRMDPAGEENPTSIVSMEFDAADDTANGTAYIPPFKLKVHQERAAEAAICGPWLAPRVYHGGREGCSLPRFVDSQIEIITILQYLQDALIAEPPGDELKRIMNALETIQVKRIEWDRESAKWVYSE